MEAPDGERQRRAGVVDVEGEAFVPTARARRASGAPLPSIVPTFVRCLDRRELAYRAALKSDLKNLASQEEIHLSDLGTYSSDPRALGVVASWGVSVEISASDGGWGAVARHVALDEDDACAIFMGTEPPPGLTEVGTAVPGEIVCST